MKVESYGIFSQEMFNSSAWPIDKFPNGCYTNNGFEENSEVLRGSLRAVTTWLNAGSASGLDGRLPMEPGFLSLCRRLLCPFELIGGRHGLADAAELYRRESCWSSHSQYDRESTRCGNRADFRSGGGTP